MRIRHLAQRIAALLGCLVAAGVLMAAAATAGDVTLTDAGGRSVQISDASRILSIGGDITEIIYALGADARLVGVDATSQFPSSCPQGQAERRLHACTVDRRRDVSRRQPHHRLGGRRTAGGRQDAEDHQRPVRRGDRCIIRLQGIAAKVRLIARAIGAEAEGEKLVNQVEQDFKDLADTARRIKQPAKAMFVLGVQNGRANVAGQGTAANAILELAGAKNVADRYERL